MSQKNTKFAVYMTILWLSGIFAFYTIGLFDKPTSFNELGDFLAGVFAPITFFWLIFGYVQQGKQIQVAQQHLARELEMRRLSVEPILKITEATFLTKSSDPRLEKDNSLVPTEHIRINILNDGDNARDINILKRGKEPEYIYQTKSIIRSGEDADFDLIIDDKYERLCLKMGNALPLSITICYKDIYGEPYSNNYTINVIRSNSGEFSIDNIMEFSN